MGRPNGSWEATTGLLNCSSDDVNIITLGDFDIQYQGQSLLTVIQRSYKLLELLRYFIAFRNRRMLSETIIDDLWPDGDCSDPKNVLRVQVYRLRKVLEEMASITKSQPELCLNLTYSNGYYLFEVGTHCRLDTDIFESAIRRAESLGEKEGLISIDLYEQALTLYNGQYMDGAISNEWLIPLQNRYHRLYLQTLHRLLEKMASIELYKEITEVYEKECLIEPCEETLHLYFIQALIELGDAKGALSHYNYITSLLYKELGVKPSAAMRSLYRQIQQAMVDNHETNLILIEKKLTDNDDMAGALYCDIDYFRFLYRLERRKSLRSASPGFLGLITVSELKQPFTDSVAQAFMKDLIHILQLCLRRGDVFSLWNKSQILLLLSVQQQIDIDTITRRLYNRFQKVTSCAQVKISIKFEPLSYENSFLT